MRRVHRARKGGRPDGQSATEESETARDEKFLRKPATNLSSFEEDPPSLTSGKGFSQGPPPSLRRTIMESIGDESSSLEITPDLGTEESTARDIKVPSQAFHQPLLLLLQNMEMVFTGTDRLLLLRSCRVTAMSHRPLRSLLTWDVILPSDPCVSPLPSGESSNDITLGTKCFCQ